MNTRPDEICSSNPWTPGEGGGRGRLEGESGDTGIHGPPVSQSDPRTFGHQEKEALEGDLKESQETLGFVVRAENARMTQVALPPTGVSR